MNKKIYFIIFIISIAILTALLCLEFSVWFSILAALLLSAAIFSGAHLALHIRKPAPAKPDAEVPVVIGNTSVQKITETKRNTMDFAEIDYPLLMLLHNQKRNHAMQQYMDKLSVYNSFTVIIISSYRDDSNESNDADLADSNLTEFANTVNTRFQTVLHDYALYGTQSPEGVALLLAQNLPQITSENTDLIENTLYTLIQESNQDIIALIGTTETEAAYIYYSYSRACGLLSRSLFQHEQQYVLSWQDKALERNLAFQQLGTLNYKFYVLAISNDIVGALNVLTEIISLQNLHLNYSLDVIIAATKEKFNTIMEIIGFGDDHTLGLDADFWKKSVKFIYHSENVEQLMANLEAIIHTFKLRYTQDNEGHSGQILKYTTYIKENYTNPALNAQMVCDYFGQTPSALSKIFKYKLRMGVLEYIHRCRIERAKILLNTDMPINDIVTQCGFYSRRAFDSVFKRYMGVSPAIYQDTVSESL